MPGETGPEANAFKFEIPVDLFGSSATSSASAYQGPMSFGDYAQPLRVDPVSGAIVAGAESLPGWLWPVVIGGAFLLARMVGK